MKNESTRCGFVGIVGRPNVGKSTLLNALLKKKLVITSKKAQTTRHSILGIKTQDNAQTIFVDTPGFREKTPGALHRYLNQKARSVVHDVDVLMLVVDADRWTADDEAAFSLLKHVKKPVFLLLNQIDKLKNRNELLPLTQKYLEKYPFAEVIPVSALKELNLDDLQKTIELYLPESEFMYEEDQLTDRTDYFVICELIREKLMRFLGKEVPYSIAVEVESMEKREGFEHVSAIIWVERKGQKAIVIGQDGENLKRVGTEARQDIEKMLERKIHLNLWVKVKEDWASNDRLLKQFGYE
jgi:GTP-binding protein Era